MYLSRVQCVVLVCSVCVCMCECVDHCWKLSKGDKLRWGEVPVVFVCVYLYWRESDSMLMCLGLLWVFLCVNVCVWGHVYWAVLKPCSSRPPWSRPTANHLAPPPLLNPLPPCHTCTNMKKKTDKTKISCISVSSTHRKVYTHTRFS